MCALFQGVNDTHRGIFCNIHNWWIHLKCTSLNKSDINELCVSTEDCYCPLCLNDIFPFNTIDDDLEWSSKTVFLT